MTRRVKGILGWTILTALVIGCMAVWWCKELQRLRTPEEMVEIRREMATLKDRLMVEFPVLAVREKQVAPEKNGFRQLYLFSERDEHVLPLSVELREIASGCAAFDAAEARRLLKEHEELVAEVERIAALPERSSLSMSESYVGFFPVTEVKQSADLLLLEARVAAAGDEVEAMEKVRLAVNLSDHLREVETPNFLTETVAFVVGRQARRTVLEEILPKLGRNADVPEWRRLLGGRTLSTARLGAVLRGEWHWQWQLLPLVFVPREPDSLPDPEAFVRAHAEAYAEAIKRLSRLSFRELAEDGEKLVEIDPQRELSKKSRVMADLYTSGTKPWSTGYARAATVEAQFDAAFQLLEWEQQGKELDAAALPVDPVTEAPFIFDPATRTVRAPSHRFFDVPGPLTLPW